MHGSQWFWTNGAEVIHPKGEVWTAEAPRLETISTRMDYSTRGSRPPQTSCRPIPAHHLFTAGR